jgi:hypothetical protein
MHSFRTNYRSWNKTIASGQYVLLGGVEKLKSELFYYCRRCQIQLGSGETALHVSNQATVAGRGGAKTHFWPTHWRLPLEKDTMYFWRGNPDSSASSHLSGENLVGLGNIVSSMCTQ